MKKLMRIVTAFVICVCGMMFQISAHAQEVPVNSAPAAVCSGELFGAPSEIQPRADVIVWKYRKYNGLIQMRRWNETKGVWVDPNWITVST